MTMSHGEPEALDKAFDLPEEICSDRDLRELYEIIVARLRNEVSRLGVSTLRELLIERIATNYIILKLRERTKLGAAGGFQHASQQKDYNLFWLQAAKELNTIIMGSSKSERDKILTEVRDIVVSTLEQVADVGVRTELVGKFSEAFDRAGI
jgi:hypothetical protein